MPEAKLEVLDSLKITPRTAEPFICGSTKQGSMYFNSTTNKHMLCNGSAWTDYTGPIGATGATGATGPQGPTGPAGTFSFSLCKCNAGGSRAWGPNGEICGQNNLAPYNYYYYNLSCRQ